MAGCKTNKMLAYCVVCSLLVYHPTALVFAQNDASEPVATPEAMPAMGEYDPDAMIDSKDVQEINILRGELATVKVHSLTRLSIADPNIADVATVDADKMMIIGKALGQTPFFIWDEFGKKTFIVRVYEEDLVYIKNRVEKLIKAIGIEGINVEENLYEGKVMLTGQLSKEKLEMLNTALSSLAGKYVNLITEEESEDLIQIDMQVAELNTTLSKNLGFDWGAETITYEEAIPTADDQLGRFIKIGEFTRTSALLLTVNNLLQEGKARLLSKPRILVISGEEAKLQVGGQYPIKTTTDSSSGSSTESVTFKDYGIGMTITPRITKGKIHIQLSIDISDIDASVETTGQGSVAFSNRTANTIVLLDDRQTIVIAGLIKTNKSLTYNKIPILGDIPILGFFFRSKQTPAADKETEVVITLTPTIIPQKEVAKKQREENSLTQEAKTGAELTKIDMPIDTAASAGATDVLPGGNAGTNASDDAAPAVVDGFSAAVEAAPEEVLAEPLVEDVALPTKESFETDAAMAADAPVVGEGITFEEPVEASADQTQTIASYVRSIQKKISEAITYPYEASEQGWSGTVKLTLHILKDGTLDEVAVKESSGHDVFDKDAINTAQILAPYASFPPELNMNEIKVTVPIVYSQGSVSLDVVCRPKHKMAQAGNKPFSFSSGKTYAEMVQERISRSILYPEQARHSGWEGMVKLNLRILRDGTLANATVKESSGNTMFDECALQTAKTLAPYSVFPAESELQDLNLTVPIIYSLNQ